MTRLMTALCLGTALTLSACSPQETAETRPTITSAQAEASATIYPARLFHETTSYRLSDSQGHAFAPDGKTLLISSDKTGIFNSYALAQDGTQTALTTSDNYPLYARSYFPNDGRVIVQGDQGGNELDHVFVRETDGSLTDLTPGKEVKARFFGWSQDGGTLYIATNERDPGSDDLYAYDVSDYSRKRIFDNDRMYLGSLTKDQRYLSLVKQNSSADADLYIADLQNGGALMHVTPHEGSVAFAPFSFTPDDKKLVFGTDEYSEYMQAWTYDMATQSKASLIEAEWDVQFVAYSPSGRYRVSAINNDGLVEVSLLDNQTGAQIPLKGLPDGALSQVRFNEDETQMAFGLNTDTSPLNVYVADLATGDTQRLTDALPGDIDESQLVTAKVVRYKSFDGLEIPGIFYMPKGASAANPVPALVWVHGGPGGQSRRGYRAMIQHWVNNGYAVLAANNRGSSGYGKTFYHMDDRRHGEEDLKDIVAAKTYLAGLPEIDGEKIGISGASYGGFMTVAALAFHPEVFDVGVNIFGVTNWDRTLKSIPPFWGAFRDALYDEMGDPATDTDRHRAISPLFSADKITKPLYVMQGANDPRVLQIESDEMVAAVEKNGVPVDYVLFPDEGHGIEKRANRVTNSERTLAFLDKYLKGE